MKAVLVDSSVLIDLPTVDAAWDERSREAILAAGRVRELVLNLVILAEVSMPCQRFEEIEERLPPNVYRREDLPWEAAFLAYRRRDGARSSPLPAFFIGAHAPVCGQNLLTRAAGSVRSDFPTVSLIEPEKRDS